MNILGKVITAIIAVLIMFIVPASYFQIKKDNIVQINVDAQTSGFTERASVQGYVTRDMYEDFIENLGETGKLYSVELEHRQVALEPEYKLRTPGEISEEDESLWTGINELHQEEISTALPVIDDPITGSINTETNESVLAAAVDTPADPDHVHKDACYAGHRNTVTDTTFIHYHKHDGSCQTYIGYVAGYGICIKCGKYYQNYWRSAYWNSVNNCVVGVGAGSLSCPECGSTAVKNAVLYQQQCYSCGYGKDTNGDGYYDWTDTTNTYSYIKSYPKLTYLKYIDLSSGNQVETPLSYTETRDCNTYHGHGLLPYIGNYSRVFRSLSGWDINPIRLFYNYGISSFCYIPQTYELIYQVEYEGNNYDVARVYFTAILQPDGSIIFKCNGGYGFNNSQKLPVSISSSEFSNSFSSPSGYEGFVQKYCDSDFKYDNSNIDKIISLATNGIIKTCPYDFTGCWEDTSGLPEDTTLDCGLIISSIEPTHPIQTVGAGDPLITTVIVTHLDGSTATKACATDFNATNIGEELTAILNYTYVVDSVTHTKSCTVTVNVIPKSKTCINGHTYNLNTDGSDPKCPYCKGCLASLSIYVPAGGKLTMYRDPEGSLETVGVGLRAVYLDGHIEYVYDGYVDNLDPDYIGTQTVTIGYKGLTTTLQAEVLRNKKKCEVCGLFYDLYPDGTDPGCPYCRAKVPIFTGKVMKYDAAVYRDEIITQLYEGSGTYHFRRGDTFSVHVESRSRADASFFNWLLGLQIKVSSSDTIKDETEP